MQRMVSWYLSYFLLGTIDTYSAVTFSYKRYYDNLIRHLPSLPLILQYTYNEGGCTGFWLLELKLEKHNVLSKWREIQIQFQI